MSKKQKLCVLFAIVLCAVANAQDSTAEKKVSFDVNASYAPMALFASDTIGTTFSPAGAQLGFTVFFVHESYGNMGAELNTSWSMAKTTPVQSKLVTHIIPVHVNFAHQYHFNARLALDSHVGVGVNMFNLLFEESNNNTGLLEFSFSSNIGTALQIAITDGLYTELGVNYIVSFPRDVVVHQLLPTLSFGYRF